MFEVESLRLIERVYRFHYPRTFWDRRQELASLAESGEFRITYPEARLVGTVEGIAAARQAESGRVDTGLPDDFIPFMVVDGESFPDYYGFVVPRRSASEGELPVVVWCIHASVRGWDAGFGAFFDEVRAQCRAAQDAEPGAAAAGGGG